MHVNLNNINELHTATHDQKLCYNSCQNLNLLMSNVNVEYLCRMIMSNVIVECYCRMLMSNVNVEC